MIIMMKNRKYKENTLKYHVKGSSGASFFKPLEREVFQKDGWKYFNGSCFCGNRRQKANYILIYFNKGLNLIQHKCCKMCNFCMKKNSQNEFFVFFFILVPLKYHSKGSSRDHISCNLNKLCVRVCLQLNTHPHPPTQTQWALTLKHKELYERPWQLTSELRTKKKSFLTTRVTDNFCHRRVKWLSDSVFIASPSFLTRKITSLLRCDSLAAESKVSLFWQLPLWFSLKAKPVSLFFLALRVFTFGHFVVFHLSFSFCTSVRQIATLRNFLTKSLIIFDMLGIEHCRDTNILLGVIAVTKLQTNASENHDSCYIRLYVQVI